MKVGDKYVIEIEEVIRRNGAPQIARIKGFNALVFDKYGLEKLEPYDWEKAYLKGYEDGKNAVINESEKITSEDINSAYTRGLNDLKSALSDKAYLKANFGTSNWLNIIMDFDPDKIVSEWKTYREDNEIKVGDEVYSDAFDDKGIVTHITADKVSCVCIICNGSTMMKVGLHGLHKTGRHFPQIAEVLAELRGEE